MSLSLSTMLLSHVDMHILYIFIMCYHNALLLCLFPDAQCKYAAWYSKQQQYTNNRNHPAPVTVFV